jgi:hypothetical protein
MNDEQLNTGNTEGTVTDPEANAPGTEAETVDVYTLEDYLRGIVRTAVSDDAIRSILARMGIERGTEYSVLSEKQRDLSTAWLYVWLSSSPTTSQKVSDKDGDWSHSEGGESMSANVLKGYLNMANELFKKWDEPLVNKERWGMICGGFHDARYYGSSRRLRNGHCGTGKSRR